MLKRTGLKRKPALRASKTQEKRAPAAEPTPTEIAVRALASRSLTERQLEQVLRRKGVAPAERAEALARVKELGYIDDAEVARVRAQRLVSRGEAPRLVARRLQSQGVAQPAAQAAADEAAGEHGEIALATLALQRKLRGRQPRDEKERQRLFRGLVQKGHRPATVAKVLGAAVEGAEGWEDDGADDDA